MAISPAHKFGQIVGEALEGAIEPVLRRFAREHDLYLDKEGRRPARRGRRVTWVDSYGNAHNLDFVLERGGTPDLAGRPVAFIETAWRRYTKHSRNKAQEIQGAILPLRDTYRCEAPFVGAVLAGVFTNGALDQLRSLGFGVAYFPYETVVDAFATAGVDAASEEGTPTSEFEQKIAAWEALGGRQRKSVAKRLLAANSAELARFVDSLTRAVTRRVASVRVTVLGGSRHDWPTITAAITFIRDHPDDVPAGPVIKYEVRVDYSNGDCVEGTFKQGESAVLFLERLT